VVQVAPIAEEASSFDEATARVRGLAREPVRRIFLTRMLNATAWLVRELDAPALSEAAAQRTDYSVLLRALEAPEIVESLASDDPLAEARLSGLRSKAFLAQAEGGTLSAEETANVLGLTRQGVDRRRRAGRLLALTLGRRGYRYPIWQFADQGMLPGMEETLAALDSFGEWSQVSWFINPNMDLDGRSPLSLLREGRVEPVVRAAHRYGEMGT
jgi:hypothetical protein